MDKYEELRLESAKRSENRHELVKRIEKREKRVFIAFNISLWTWAIIWWFIWFFEIAGKFNLFLSILIFIVVCFVSDVILMNIFFWITRIVRKTTK